MRRVGFWRTVGGLLLAAGSVCAQSGGGYDLRRSAIDCGGGPSAAGTYRVDATIGQRDAGIQSGGSYTLRGGFWGGIPQGAAPSPTQSPSTSASRSPTPIATPTGPPTVSVTTTRKPTSASTLVPSATQTPTSLTPAASATPNSTTSTTPTGTVSPAVSSTSTRTPTGTISGPPTATFTLTGSPSVTATGTVTVLASVTPTATTTPAPTSTATATVFPGYHPGDSNCDGAVSAADVSDLFARIASPQTPLCGADANGDLVVDTNDLPVLIERLFGD